MVFFFPSISSNYWIILLLVQTQCLLHKRLCDYSNTNTSVSFLREKEFCLSFLSPARYSPPELNTQPHPPKLQ